jgi:hypothetical protein
MLLCDIASLSRLSITIVSLTGFYASKTLDQLVRSRFDGSDYTIVIRKGREDESRLEDTVANETLPLARRRMKRFLSQ